MPYVASICLLEYTKSYFAIFTVHLLIYPNKQSFLGVYRNHPGGLSKCSTLPYTLPSTDTDGTVHSCST